MTLSRPKKFRTPGSDPRAAWLEAKNLFGGQYIAAAARMTPQAIYNWEIVPAEWCVLVERCTGVSRHRLRPDIYGELAVSLADVGTSAAIAIQMTRLAKNLNLTLRELARWDRVPPEYVLRVEKLTGVSRYVLRPDVFGVEPFNPAAEVEAKAQAVQAAEDDADIDGSSVAA